MVDDDHYIFLPEITLEGHSADLSPDHNAVWARCYLNTYWAWLPEIVLYFFSVQVIIILHTRKLHIVFYQIALTEVWLSV